MLISGIVWHALKYAFSVVGRIASISNACARAVSRGFWAGSERMSVHLRRIVVLRGVGTVSGIGLVICDGSEEAFNVCVRARTP